MATHVSGRTRVAGRRTAALTLAAIGVVYGDIGTSPLYTVKEVFGNTGHVPFTPANVVGAVSAIFWALTFVVTFKYVILVLRADNRGEGGLMALLALASHAAGRRGGPRLARALLLTGAFGAALFYGDSVITPAISVLSAVEGLEVVTPALKAYVLPLSVAILIGLFLVQRHGTEIVGRYFGPVTLLWFITLAITGGNQILHAPEILEALDPRRAFAFLVDQGFGLFFAVGAIVLAVTGAEALYADMGHFGRGPIRIAWNTIVFPALALNYAGQGALLLKQPTALENPFYRLFPEVLLLPAVALAALATIIASQAVISGAYSMTQQAIQLGFLPRMQIVHTSEREKGQIYVPMVNWTLLIMVIIASIGFGSSSALAAAYGIAVTITMFVTTVLTFFVVRYAWRYPLPLAVAATGVFAMIDALLVASTSLKFLQGGWFPIALGIIIVIVMSTWKRGREMLLEKMRSGDPELEPFLNAIIREDLPRVPRTAVYLVGNPETVPQAFLHNLKHNMVLHERNVITTVIFQDIPWIGDNERVKVDSLCSGFWRVLVHYGFMNTPDLPKALELCKPHGLDIELFQTSFFVSREIVVPVAGSGMAPWREKLFATLSRNAGSIVGFFNIPANAVIELGTRVQI